MPQSEDGTYFGQKANGWTGDDVLVDLEFVIGIDSHARDTCVYLDPTWELPRAHTGCGGKQLPALHFAQAPGLFAQTPRLIGQVPCTSKRPHEGCAMH
jgi:hypothetical protein